MKKYLTRKQVSELYPISHSTLADYASRGIGPVYRIIGRSAVYKIDELEDWIEKQAVELKPRLRNRKRLRS